MLSIQKEPAPTFATLEERRRAGRKEVNPALLAMFRDPTAGPTTLYSLPYEPPTEHSKPLLGILLALLLAVPLWVTGVAIGYFVFG